MRELVITDTAKEDLVQITHFLKTNYSERVKTDFLEAFSKRLSLIEDIPSSEQISYYTSMSCA